MNKVHKSLILSALILIHTSALGDTIENSSDSQKLEANELTQKTYNCDYKYGPNIDSELDSNSNCEKLETTQAPPTQRPKYKNISF